MGLIVSVREVKDPRIDLGVDNGVDDLGLVLVVARLLADLLYHLLQGSQLHLDLPLRLMHTQTFPVYQNQFGSLLVESHVVLGPVDEHLLEVSLRDALLVLVTSLAEGEDAGKGVIDGSRESEGEALLALGDGEGSVHGPLLVDVGVLLGDDFPGCASCLLVHLDHDLGGCREGVFGLGDGASPDGLTGDLEFVGDELFHLSVEFLLERVEVEHDDLGLAVLVDVGLEFCLPAVAVRAAGDEARVLEAYSKGSTGLFEYFYEGVGFLVVVLVVLAVGVDDDPVLEVEAVLELVPDVHAAVLVVPDHLVLED